MYEISTSFIPLGQSDKASNNKDPTSLSIFGMLLDNGPLLHVKKSLEAAPVVVVCCFFWGGGGGATALSLHKSTILCRWRC